MSKKGCDASNIYDEEVPEQDREFSDDEKEKEAKKARKNKNKRKAAATTQGGSDSEEGALGEDEDAEEGEIKGGQSRGGHGHQGKRGGAFVQNSNYRGR